MGKHITRWCLIAGLMSAACTGPSAPSPGSEPAIEVIEAVATLTPDLQRRMDAATLLTEADDGFSIASGAHDLGTALPLHADGAWRLDYGARGTLVLDAALMGASAVEGRLVDGAVLYEGIHPGTDAVVRANHDQVELFYVLEDETAPRTWTWRATMPSGGAWRSCPSGAELVDTTGHVRFHATRPVAFDQDGTRLAMSMRIREGEIEYELVGAAHIDWPVVVDPGFDIAYWERRYERSPTPLDEPALAYDAARGVTVLYGGLHFGGAPQDDTWTWDGTAWTVMAPPTRPPPLQGSSMVYDAARREILLFGGFDGARFRDELWRWNGSDWTLLVRAPAPTGLTVSTMAYDDATQTVLLFGAPGPWGRRDPLASETWTWSGTGWTAHHPPVSPEAANYPSLAFDPASGSALLVSSGGGGDTWRWDGAGWSIAATWRDYYPQAVVTDPILGRAVSISTITEGDRQRAEWTGTDWRVTPTAHPVQARSYLRIAFDEGRNRVVLYGSGSAIFGDRRGLGDLHEHDGIGWTLLSPDIGPRIDPVRLLGSNGGQLSVTDGETIFDWVGDRFVEAGALGIDPSFMLAPGGDGVVFALRVQSGALELRQRAGGVWTTLSSGSPPSDDPVDSLAWHAGTGQLLVMLGAARSGRAWVWNGTTWAADADPVGPAAGRYQLVYDPLRSTIIAVGLTPAPPSFAETWEWSGALWRLLDGRTPCCGALGHDSGRGETVLGAFDGTYRLAAVGWVRAGSRPFHDPLPTLGFDPRTSSLLEVSRRARDVWRWDGAGWLPMPIRAEGLYSPYSSAGRAIAVEADTGRVIRMLSIGDGIDRFEVDEARPFMSDGTHLVLSGAPLAYAGAGRGVMAAVFDQMLWSPSGVTRVAPLPASAVVSGYDRRSNAVIAAGSGPDTFVWSGAVWSAVAAPPPGMFQPWNSTATDPTSGSLHVTFGSDLGDLWMWTGSAWVLRETVPFSLTTLGPHDARGSLVAVDRDMVVREGIGAWAIRDARGIVPGWLQVGSLAYHGPTDSLLDPAYALRLLSDVGLPCGSVADCGGGFCVDGVCCDDPCGGGVTDCMACSVAVGGTLDGHCGALRAGLAETIECRASAGVCDVAERCSTETRICPGDAVAADGMACSDALTCNGEESCRGGACESGPSPCDDGDACTADACDEPARCLHLERPGCCRVDVECGDGDPCTRDACLANACVHEYSCTDGGSEDGGIALDVGPIEPRDGGPIVDYDVPIDAPRDGGESMDADRGGIAGGSCGCRAHPRAPPTALVPVGVLSILLGLRRRRA